MAITFRTIRFEDEAFLREVYASTRRAEFALVDWAPEQVEAFLATQFQAQHRYYVEHYRGAAFLVIEQDGVPIGRLYVARWQEEIRIVDIALLPEYRSGGIGTALLRGVLAEGAASGIPVTIHVEKFNPALRLYRRLGFSEVDDRGVYLLMAWHPPVFADKVAIEL